MGCTASTPVPEWPSFQRPFQGAGCLFSKGDHALVGLHASKHGHVRICGFGGKREAEEPWWQTAFRETVEELLEPERIPFNLYHALRSMPPPRLLYDAESEYVVLVYSTEDLETFLRICGEHVTTPLYTTFPKTAEDLVFHRKPQRSAEISDIVFWPTTNRHRMFRVTRDLMGDMKALRSLDGPV
jgi:hypothetical protein